MRNEDVLDRVWTGVVPTYMRLEEPVAGPYNRVNEVPEHIGGWVSGENERRRRGCVEGAKKVGSSSGRRWRFKNSADIDF